MVTVKKYKWSEVRKVYELIRVVHVDVPVLIQAFNRNNLGIDKLYFKYEVDAPVIGSDFYSYNGNLFD